MAIDFTKTLMCYRLQLPHLWHAKQWHPHYLSMKHHAPIWRRIAFYIEQMRYRLHRLDQNLNFQDFNMVDSRPQSFIALRHHLLPTMLQNLLKQPYFSKLQQNHCLPLRLFVRLSPPYNQQSTRANPMPKERDPSCGTSSTKLDSHPNSFVKSTTQPLLNNILIALLTAWVLGAFLCMYRFGIIGLAGANATHTPG